MMKHKIMNRFHKRNSSSPLDFKSDDKLHFKFSSLQALQVPAGWDKLTLSLICVESDKTVTKTGRASVWNGNCRWTESLSESIWLSQGDSSKELQQCLYKLLISKGSTRSSILGEVTVNLSNYLTSEASHPVALPLIKCDHGTLLQVAIQCVTPRANLRFVPEQEKLRARLVRRIWRESNSFGGDVNSDYSDLDSISEAADTTNITNVGSSTTNSIPDTSHGRGLGSRETSSSTVRSHHSFDSMEDSFGRESSISNLSEVAVDLIGKPEPVASQSSTPYSSVNAYESPKSSRSPFSPGSGKNSLNRRQDSGIRASPLRSFGSSEFVLDEEITAEELRAEVRTWERNARKLKVDLDLSRNETINQTKNLENVTMELSALQTECKGLRDEIKHLKVLLGESAGKQRDAASLKVQVQDKNDIQAELEEEIIFQKDLNNTLALQLDKTQESNVELVSVLQELEETIEKQRLEIKSLGASGRPTGDSDHEDSPLEAPKADLLMQVDDRSKLELELQKFQGSQKELESTIQYLEKTLEEKSLEIELERDLKTQMLLNSESEWTKKLSLKDKEILKLEGRLSEALAAPVSTETEYRKIETPDLVEEVKVLKEKVLELERDCNELTDENLDLLYKLKESGKDLSTSIQGSESPSVEDSEVGNTAARYLQIRCNDLDSKCIKLEAQLSDLQLVNSRLEENLEVTQKELNDTKESHILCSKKLKELESCNQELELHLTELEEDNLDLSGRISGLESQLRYLTDARESSRLEAEHSESQVVKLQAEIERLENEVETIRVDTRQKVEDMQKRWLEAQEECEYLKKANPKLQSTTENLMEECSSLQKSNSELRQQRSELHNRCTDLETKLSESLDNFSKVSKNLEDLEENLLSMLDGIASKEKLLDSELDGLHVQFKEHTENCTSSERLLNQMYREKVVEVEKLQQEVEHLSTQISATHDERERMASEAVLEVHVLRAEKDKMEKNIVEIEGKLGLSEKMLDTVQVESEETILELKGQLATSQQNHGVLAANHEKLIELLENTRSSEEKLKNTVGELSANLKSCEYQNVQLTEEISNLKDQMQKIPILQDEIVALKNSLNDMKYENERLEASSQMISEDFQQLKQENAALVEKASSMQNMVIELEEHKRNKIVLEEKLLRLEGDLTAREALGAQDAELKNEVGRLKRSNSQLQWKIDRLQEENDEYMKKIEALEDQKNGLKSDGNELATSNTDLSNGSYSTSSPHDDLKLTEDVEANTVDESSRIQSLESALAEALEANEMYKLQLKRFV
ncbi:EEIG1/EHBP1 N-terminal domain-containing protein [Tanacetum coccineum]